MCTVEGAPLRKPKLQLLPDDQPIPIYLDHNATTPVCDEAWLAMMDCRDVWGNPSSAHPHGAQAKYVVERARRTVADALSSDSVRKVEPDEIIFTSGGTESNNLAIIGGAIAARRALPEREHILSTNFEHPAVEEVLKKLSEPPYNFVVHRMAVDSSNGVLSVATTLHTTLNAIHDGNSDDCSRVALVTVMHANNELGSIQPITEIVQEIRRRKGGDITLIHTDAAQSIGKIAVTPSKLGVNMLSVCSHKFYGPKGVGALFIDFLHDGSTSPLHELYAPHFSNPTLFGAGHERGLRPGTENVILICGMAAALKKAVADLMTSSAHSRVMRSILLEEMKKHAALAELDLLINGSLETALPNTLNVSVFHRPTGLFCSAARLVQGLGAKVCFSSGSACHSLPSDDDINALPEVSLPLQAVNVDLERAVGTLRLTTGALSTETDMKRAAQIIMRACANQMPES